MALTKTTNDVKNGSGTLTTVVVANDGTNPLPAHGLLMSDGTSFFDGAVGGRMVRVDTSFTREANATPYTAGDVISAAAATVVPAIAFANFARVNGGGGYIKRCRVWFNVKSVTPRLRVRIYNVNTATVSGDNLPARLLDADATKEIASYDLPAMITGADTTNSTGSFTPDLDINVPFVADAASRTLYATIEALDAVTLTSASTVKISLFGDVY